MGYQLEFMNVDTINIYTEFVFYKLMKVRLVSLLIFRSPLIIQLLEQLDVTKGAKAVTSVLKRDEFSIPVPSHIFFSIPIRP